MEILNTTRPIVDTYARDLYLDLLIKTVTNMYIIFDDYKLLRSVKAAASDYRSLMGIEAPIREVDWNSAWWQKPHAASRGAA